MNGILGDEHKDMAAGGAWGRLAGSTGRGTDELDREIADWDHGQRHRILDAPSGTRSSRRPKATPRPAPSTSLRAALFRTPSTGARRADAAAPACCSAIAELSSPGTGTALSRAPPDGALCNRPRSDGVRGSDASRSLRASRASYHLARRASGMSEGGARDRASSVLTVVWQSQSTTSFNAWVRLRRAIRALA